jgi:hypothetical protein
METYTDLVEDLQRTEPENVSPLILPFNDSNPFTEQFDLTYASLQRNVQLKSRLLSLTDAYFLGKLLNGLHNRTVRLGYCQRLTVHYQRMVENVFDIRISTGTNTTDSSNQRSTHSEVTTNNRQKSTRGSPLFFHRSSRIKEGKAVTDSGKSTAERRTSRICR